MSDSRSAPLSLDLISKTMNELAQEIGEMEPSRRNGIGHEHAGRCFFDPLTKASEQLHSR